MNNFLLILLFLSPVILGGIVYFFKFDQAVSTIESLNGWIIKKREKYIGQPGFYKKLVIRPCLWCSSAVMTTSEKIEDKYMRTAVRVGAYLYLFSIFLFLAYMAISLVIVLILLALAFWVLSFFTESDTPVYRKSSIISRMRNKNVYNTRGVFSKQTHQIDENGNVYDTSGVFVKKVAEINENGTIQDTTGIFHKEVGKIDENGKVYDTTGIIYEKVAEINENGVIEDTTGVFNKEIGKIN